MISKSFFTKALSLLFILGTIGLYAQEAVTGTVVDTEGNPLPGVSVTVDGTTRGTSADLDGNFSISVSEGETILFSFLGKSTQSVVYSGQSSIDIILTDDIEALDEVVVTALGISKEKKSLGYGVSTLSAESISDRPEADVGRLIRGKASGVDIVQSSGLSGTGTNIIIRGYSSISGSNQPLFIVDGVPFNSDTNTDRSYVQGGATASSRFLDLDPNNIAEISILKGLSATVLYGEAGKNGVILVTTKTGRSTRSTSKKGFDVSFNQNVSFSQVANLPKYQNTYGNGFSGTFGWFFSNWGPAFSVRGRNGIDENGQIDHPYDQARYNDDFPEFEDVRYDYKAYESVENFFDTGIATNTSVNVNKNVGDNSTVAFTYSFLNDDSFLPQEANVFSKHNISLGGTTKLDNGLQINSSFNYIDSDRKTPPAAVGEGNNPFGASLFANLLYTPRSIDLNNLPFQSPLTGEQVYYRRGSPITNPRWTLNNASDTEKIRRFFGNVSLNYQVSDFLTVYYRFGLDQYSQRQTFGVNRGSSQTNVIGGRLVTSDRINEISDHVLNLNFDFDLTPDFSIDGIVGTNFRRETRDQNTLFSTEQFIFDIRTHTNFQEHASASFQREENNLGVYLSTTLSYKDYLYLNLQGRNDVTSTLESDNNSIFYPSASLSFVPTTLIPELSNFYIDFLKVRVGYGTSAGYPNPYQTRSILTTGTRSFIDNNGSVLNVNRVSSQIGNQDLKPELLTEVEFGLEGAFWNGRINVDFSWYDKRSKDLIIPLELDPSTGFTSTVINSAELSNTGVELGVNATVLQLGDFTWALGVNYTKNINEVVSVADGVDQVRIAEQFSFDGVNFSTTTGTGTSRSVSNWAIPGERYGVIQGTKFQRNGNDLIVDSRGNYDNESDISIIGDPNPEWLGNVSTTLSWKGLSFYMQWSYVQGGDIYSTTTATLLSRGNTIDTDVDRDLGFILDGVNVNDGVATPNNEQTFLGDISFQGYFAASEGAMFDGTHIRLSELSLSYALPKSILENLPIGNVSFTLAGQNLWFFAPNFPEGVNYDPGVLSTGVGNNRGLELITGPTARKISLALNLTF